MFSKFATFRSKGSSDQKGKQNYHGRFTSDILHTEEGNPSKDVYYFSVKEIPAHKSVPDASFSEPAFLSYDASNVTSPFSDRNSSWESNKSFSTLVHQERLSMSSGQSEEIVNGTPFLISYEDAEEQFLEDHEGYFLHLLIDNVRKDHYPMLHKIVYLDNGTCPPYSRFQVDQHMKFLLEETVTVGWNYTINKQITSQNVYIKSLYQHILNFLNTIQEDFSIIFTHDLGSCYRLFAEMYQLRKGSHILISPDLHSPVKHILQVASQSNVKVGQIPLKKKDLSINGTELHKLLRNQGWSGHGSGLLVYSAQSFSTGICHSLSWITGAQQNGWKVVLDVSSSLPTVCVDLSLYQPEFVVGSLHHMLGYPSPLSFLLVRRSSHSISTRKGSIDLQFVEHPETGKAVHVVTESENLTMHNFAALNFGLEHLKSIGIGSIQRRVESLMSWLIKTLKSLKHKLDEKPLIQFYGSLDLKNRGSILSFNVLDPTGNVFPAKPVQQLAERNNIILGSCSLIDAKIANLLHLKSNKNKQMEDLNLNTTLCNLHCLRLSLGAVSTFSDTYRLVQFLSWFRDDKYMSHIAAGYAEDIVNEF